LWLFACAFAHTKTPLSQVSKKKIIVLTLLFTRGALAFSNEILSFNTFIEDWLSVGITYGADFKSPIASDNYMQSSFGSLGANINFYSFTNWHNLGYFIHLFFLLPDATIYTKQGANIYEEEVLKSQFGLLIGPGYRLRIDYDSSLHFAGGLYIDLFNGSHKSTILGTTTPTELTGLNIGAGFDIGYRKSMTDSFFVDFGLIFAWDFSSTVFIELPGGERPKYVWLMLKPYVSLGVSLVIDKTWYLRIGDEGYYN
jgi:hypothetical protein